jgi:hypothetical protein
MWFIRQHGAPWLNKHEPRLISCLQVGQHPIGSGRLFPIRHADAGRVIHHFAGPQGQGALQLAAAAHAGFAAVGKTELAFQVAQDGHIGVAPHAQRAQLGPADILGRQAGRAPDQLCSGMPMA